MAVKEQGRAWIIHYKDSNLDVSIIFRHLSRARVAYSLLRGIPVTINLKSKMSEFIKYDTDGSIIDLGQVRICYSVMETEAYLKKKNLRVVGREFVIG